MIREVWGPQGCGVCLVRFGVLSTSTDALTCAPQERRAGSDAACSLLSIPNHSNHHISSRNARQTGSNLLLGLFCFIVIAASILNTRSRGRQPTSFGRSHRPLMLHRRCDPKSPTSQWNNKKVEGATHLSRQFPLGLLPHLAGSLGPILLILLARLNPPLPRRIVLPSVFGCIEWFREWSFLSCDSCRWNDPLWFSHRGKQA